MKTNRNRVLIIATLILFAFGLILPAGCGNSASKPPQQEPGKLSLIPAPGEKKETVTLFFSDSQAQYLNPEDREITRNNNESLEEAVLKELIKGPERAGLHRTIPQETRILSVSVANGVAEVNFSSEFRSRHWGGSAGETMTLYSVVNTLAKLPGITSVQFMIDGKKMDSLAGHIEAVKPLKPDWKLVKGQQN